MAEGVRGWGLWANGDALRFGDTPAHGGLSLRPQGRARFENFRGRKFSAVARRKRTAFTFAEIGLGDATRRRSSASSSPRSIRSQRESAVGRRTTRGGCVPVCPSPHPRTPPPPRSAAPFPWGEASWHVPRGEKIARLGVLVLAELRGLALFSPSGKWDRAALVSRRGPCGAGGCAFRGLTRSATEWSAARRKPLRAVAMHPSAAIFADVKARRLPTSGRRKFPSAEIFEARATLREQSGSTLGRRVHRPPGLSPFARNRGMSPFSGIRSER